MIYDSRKHDLYPSVFTPLEQLPSEIADHLRPLYASGDPATRTIAAYLNHCFSARACIVLSAESIYEAVGLEDPNITYKLRWQGGRHAASFKVTVQKEGIFSVLEKSSKGVRKAGCMALEDQYLQLFHFTEEEKDACVARYKTMKAKKKS